MSSATIDSARRISGDDRLLGSAGAPIQVVMYGDLGSRRSASTYRSIRQAMEAHRSVSLAHRYLITPTERSPRSAVAAAEAAEAAEAQGQFWEMLDLIYGSGSDPSSLITHCRTLGLDEARVRNSIVNRRGALRIDHDVELAGRTGVVSAPELFVNSVRWPTDDRYRSLVGDLVEVAGRAQALWNGSVPRPEPTKVCARAANDPRRLSCVTASV